MKKKYFAHATADISVKALIGDNSKIWHHSHIREGVKIGKNCIIGRNVYVDFSVNIGNKCKIQNNCSIYHGTNIEDGVFIGPHVVFTNDKNPRAINKNGQLKTHEDYSLRKIFI